MVSWGFLIDEVGLAALLPDEYRYFAPPISRGLALFLEGLPEAHQAEILDKQSALPPSASVAERLGLLARSCPVLQKLGQILARDQRLAEELRIHLRELESLPSTVSLEAIQEVLHRELGPLDRRNVILRPPALAEASVAVVIPFEQSDGREGVFKLLKPGIELRLEQELGLLGRVGAFLDEQCEELKIPHLDYEESFQQVRDKLHYEVRLDGEQNHLAQARAFYADEPSVEIPAIFEDHCTTRVTAMQRVTGGKVTDHDLTSHRAKQRLAALVVKSLLAKPIFSTASEVMFHSDPHAGNLFLTSEQRLAILDWSLVGELSESQRVAIVQIMLGAVTLDAERIVRILENLANRQRIDRAALGVVVQKWLGRIRHGQFPGLAWLIGMLDDAVQLARLRVAADLMLFRKTLHTLEGVTAAVGPEGFQIDGVLCREFLRHFAMEWPRRWITKPSSRQFATRLSNFDLTQTAWNYPATWTRFWLGQGRDLLDACRPTDKVQGITKC